MVVQLKRTSICLGLVTLSLFGCQSVPVEELPANADPSAEISKLDTARNDAFAQQADVLSPKYFEKASDNLQEAKEERSKGKDNEKILKKVSEGNADMNKVKATLAAAMETIPDVVQARQDAVKAHAWDEDNKEFRAADKELTSVGRDLEKDNKGPAQKKRADLVKQYNDIELTSLRALTIRPAQAVLNDAMKEGAKTIAPATLSEVDSKFKEANSLVDVNRHNQASLDQTRDNLLASAQHLLKVTRDAKAIGGPNAEQVVLQREAEENRLAAERQALQAKEAQLQNAQAQLSTTQSENAQLSQIKAMQDKLASVKATFNTSEADIFQDGNRLVIRLKDLAFANGRSAIPSKRFGLMKKVDNAIATLAPAAVMVEGHTDSTGKAKANKALSQERADSVRAYLEANLPAAAQGTTISAEGFGDSRPIAANSSKKGRAQNRRVDVIITPAGGGEVAH